MECPIISTRESRESRELSLSVKDSLVHCVKLNKKDKLKKKKKGEENI